jgi:hypothetical protein
MAKANPAHVEYGSPFTPTEQAIKDITCRFPWRQGLAEVAKWHDDEMNKRPCAKCEAAKTEAKGTLYAEAH